MVIDLTPETVALIEGKIARGRYDSADAAITAALRLLDARDRHHDWLRGKMADAAGQVARGDVIEFTDALLDDLDREIDERVRRGDVPNPDVCP